MEDLITTQEAAELLGVSSRYILALIASGRLPARTFGNARSHLIARDDLKLVEHRPRGRPAGSKNKKKGSKNAP
jgi:excisionase family DNA binding protein